jgi:hypothetical protein
VGWAWAGREERREDVDEGRSGDWLEIGEMSKKNGRQKILHPRLVSVGVRGRNFFIRPSGDPIPPPGVTTLNETLFPWVLFLLRKKLRTVSTIINHK